MCAVSRRVGSLNVDSTRIVGSYSDVEGAGAPRPASGTKLPGNVMLW